MYNPYTSAIYIHDNIYKRKKQFPTLKHEIGKLFFLKFWRDVPDIIFDGMLDPYFFNSNNQIYPDRNLCLKNNKDAEFLNLDINNNFEKWYTPFISKFSKDKSYFSCELDPISKTQISCRHG